MSSQTISPHDLYRHITLGHSVLLLDVRTQDEYEKGHIVGAVFHPLESLEPESSIEKIRIAYPFLPTIYITGNSDEQAQEALQQFSKAGYDYLVTLQGGTPAWISAGLPIERTQKTVFPFQHQRKNLDVPLESEVENNILSIDQQIKVIVGSVVGLGTLLGTFINTGFLAIPFFVGTALAYEGLFETDYIRQFVSNLYWNKKAK
ncbi:MAG: rhodanese-like domain-containing protein [Alphaproteobacteria bacterium]|nr:rhodanese-like domain-containing protein [Alphaproteobacteria bacterium]